MHNRSTAIGIYLLAGLLLAVNVSCFAYAATVEATGLTWEHIGMARLVGGMSVVLVLDYCSTRLDVWRISSTELLRARAALLEPG